MNKVFLLIISVLFAFNGYAQSLKSVEDGIQIRSTTNETVWGLTESGLTTPDGRLVTPKQLGVTLEATSREIYVSTYTGNDNTGDGTSWGTAFATFDKAIDAIGNFLNATVTVYVDSGTYYCSKASSREILSVKYDANVDLLFKGMTDTLTTLTGIVQDAVNPFKYNVTNSLTLGQFDSCFVNGNFRLPIHSNGTDYVYIATAESAGVGAIVTKNKTKLIFDDSDHIVFNYLSEYSRGGITFEDFIIKPLGNKALRFASFGTSKLKFDGCLFQALNVQNNNAIINQCHLFNTQRGIVLNNYNSFIEQSVIHGPGKTSGKACFDIQNGSAIVDNLIIDGFGQVFENSQGIGIVSFYDNSSDLFVLNSEKIFTANDGFSVGTGNLNTLTIENVDYLYNTISDKNVGIILDTAIIEGNPVVSYVESDNGIRVVPEKNYIAYIKGIHDSLDYIIPTKKYVDDANKIGGSAGDILFNDNGIPSSLDSLNENFTFNFSPSDSGFYLEESSTGSYLDFSMKPTYPYIDLYLSDKNLSSSYYYFGSPFVKQQQIEFDSSANSYASGTFNNQLGQASYLGNTYKWKYAEFSLDTSSNKGYGGIRIIPTSKETYRPDYYSGAYFFYDGGTSHTHLKTNMRVWEDGLHFSHNSREIMTIKDSSVAIEGSLNVTSLSNDNDTSIAVKKSIYTETDTLASSGSITIDCNKSNVFYSFVTDDITSLDIINYTSGGTYIVILEEDSGGGNAITLASTFNKEMSSHTAFDDTGGITNVLWIMSDGTNIYYSNTPTTN